MRTNTSFQRLYVVEPATVPIDEFGVERVRLIEPRTRRTRPAAVKRPYDGFFLILASVLCGCLFTLVVVGLLLNLMPPR